MSNEIKRDYYDNGNICSEEYYLDGKPHREDGPAKIAYNQNGNIKIKEYYINGKRHREDGPALIAYGNINCEVYYINDELHRENGPAWIEYDANGNISTRVYYLNGKDFGKFIKNRTININKDLIIKEENNINKLKLMKIIANENKQQEYVDLIDSKIISLTL